MKQYGDEVGLMWQEVVKDRGRSASVMGALPPVTWEAPTDFPSLSGIPRLCVDVETFDPDLFALGPGVRRGGYILGLALGWDHPLPRRGYWPVAHASGNLNPDTVKAWAKYELNNYEGEIVGTKLDYDLDFLAEWGITFPKVKAIHDVQICEPLLDEWRLKYALDALSWDYLGVGKEYTLLDQIAQANGWLSEKAVKSNLWQLPAGHVGPYAEGDVDRPLRILPLQLKKLEEEGLMPIYTVERKLPPILVNARRHGVRVDIPRAEMVREKIVELRDSFLNEARRLAGPQVELMQPDSFVDYLREQNIAVPLTPQTKKPSVTKFFLEKHQSDPLVFAIMQGRKYNTTVNNFIDGAILQHNIKGRIHCSFNQLKGDDSGTIARLSSSNPNLQQVPARDEKIAPLIRSIFIPDEGGIWQSDDYSQIEYRLLAHYAIGQGAEEARRRYNEDPSTDFHKYVAEAMKIDPEDKLKRKRVKNINFAKGYGARGLKLSQLMNCSVAEAEDFMRQYDSDLPFAAATFDACQKSAVKRGFVTSIMGRKQRFTLWEPIRNWEDPRPALRHDDALAAYGTAIRRYMTYAAMNRKFQSSGADIMKAAMVDAHEAGIFNYIQMLLTVHDELDNNVPKTKAALDAARELTAMMSRVVKLKVPLTVTSSQGSNWGEV